MREHVPEDGWRFARCNGLNLAFLEEGEGPLMVLVHGFPDTAHTWDALRPRFAAAGYRVVTPALRGIAPSEIPPSDDYKAEVLGRDVLALIDALGAPSAVVIGHDWGALAAYAAATLDPSRVSRLVTLAIPHPTTFRFTPRKLWGARHFQTLRLPGAVGRFARDPAASVRALYERWSPGFAWPDEEFEAALNAYAAPGCLCAALGFYRQIELPPARFLRAGVTVPTLVLGGRTDGVADEDDFRRSMARLNPRSKVQLVPGGHFAHREDPDAFYQAVMDFLGADPSLGADPEAPLT